MLPAYLRGRRRRRLYPGAAHAWSLRNKYFGNKSAAAPVLQGATRYFGPADFSKETAMGRPIDRREFLQLAGLGGAVFASGLAGCAGLGASRQDDFYFVQLSDTHWGFKGPALNPDADGTLQKAVAAVNALAVEPDFIVFTGDLTHTTDDPKERRRRLAEFRDIVGALRNKNVRFMPGEHDASLDNGQAWKEFFGPSYYSFDHKGVHFIAVDNVSDASARIGDVV